MLGFSMYKVEVREWCMGGVIFREWSQVINAWCLDSSVNEIVAMKR